MEQKVKHRIRAILAGFSIVTAVGAVSFWGEPLQPYKWVEVRFCPNTANQAGRKTPEGIIKPEEYEKAQADLDYRFCRRTYRLLAEVWEKKNWMLTQQLPDSIQNVRVINPVGLDNRYWYLSVPVLCLAAYLLLSANNSDVVDGWLAEYETFKIAVLTLTEKARASRDLLKRDIDLEQQFKEEILERDLNLLKVKEKLISFQGLQELAAKQTEIEGLEHDYNKSVINKGISENVRDKAKADAETRKLSNQRLAKKDDPKEELREKLLTHDDGWLMDVVACVKPLWVLGEMGSGKSTFAASVALCRLILFDWQLELIVDSHGQANINDAWEYLMKIPNPPVIKGSENNYPEIAKAFEDRKLYWAKRMGIKPPPPKTQFIVDEMTQLSIQPELKDAAEAFIRHSMSDPRKAKDVPIFLAHGFTNAATGNAVGFKDIREKGTYMIERFSADGDIPKPEAKLQRGVDNVIDVVIPSWFTPEKISQYLGKVKKADTFQDDLWAEK